MYVCDCVCEREKDREIDRERVSLHLFFVKVFFENIRIKLKCKQKGLIS